LVNARGHRLKQEIILIFNIFHGKYEHIKIGHCNNILSPAASLLVSRDAPDTGTVFAGYPAGRISG
jgi:hypothetical protein